MTPIMKGNKQAPMDYNVAKAVYFGLFEYLVDLCDCNEGRLAKPLEGLLKILGSTAILPATKKAIRTREKEIRARIDRVKERLPYLFSCMATIEKIVDIAMTRGSDEEQPEESKENQDLTCEFCYEKCIKGTTRKCPFCKSIVYCSSDCLQLNWMLHQKSCILLRKYPAPTTKEQINEDGKAIFTRFLQKILLQASLKGFSILFCFVVVDMAESTPLLRTLTPEQFFQSYMLEEEVVQKSKETFERNKDDGALTVSFVGFTEEGLSVSVLTFPSDVAPLHLGPSVREAIDTERWSAAQREVSGKSFQPGMLQKIQANPKLWQASLLQTMKP